MGSSEISTRAVAMPERCRCGHTKARHELAGFDGDCIADGCRCTDFRLVEHDIVQPTPARQPNPASGALNSVEQVVTVARSIGSKRMLLTAARVEHLVAELRALIFADRAKARAEAVKAQIDAIDSNSKGKGRRGGAKVDGKQHPCALGECERTFTSAQAVGTHRRRAHPNTKSTTQPEGETA